MNLKCTVLACVLMLPNLTVIPNSQSESERIIRRMIKTGTYEGHDSKVIGPMGDEAAVIAAKVLGGRALSTPEMDTVLTILYQSFADPSQVDGADSRKPRTALLLLRYFELSTQDTGLKGRIESTRTYILEHYAKSLTAH